jgi:hypothetical protein
MVKIVRAGAAAPALVLSLFPMNIGGKPMMQRRKL